MKKEEENKPKFHTVWVIDDQQVDLFLASKIFTNHAEVESIYLETNAPKALKKLKKITNKDNFPDLLLLDVEMRQMDGFAFMDELTKMALFHASGCRVCLISAFFSPISYTSKAMDYPYLKKLITKPLKAKHLAGMN